MSHPVRVEIRHPGKTIMGRIFCLFKKMKMFSKSGSIFYSILMLIYFMSALLLYPKVDIDPVVTTILCIVQLVSQGIKVLNPVLSHQMYTQFAVSIPKDEIPLPANLFIIFFFYMSEGLVCFLTAAYVQRVANLYAFIYFMVMSCIVGITTPIPFLILGSSVSYLNKKAKEVKESETMIEDSRNLIKIYNNLRVASQNSLFILYSGNSLLIIAVAYSISGILNGCFDEIAEQIPYQRLSLVIGNAVYLLVPVSTLIYLAITMDQCYQSIHKVRVNFRSKMLTLTSEEERVEHMLVLHELQHLEPFTARGFYNVRRTTLTATLGTVITYFIILVQTAKCS